MIVKMTNATDSLVSTITKDRYTYRVEIRNGEGKIMHYKLKACRKSEARMEASEIASALATASKKPVLWRMTNDRDWSIASENRKHLVKNGLKGKLNNLKQKIDEFFWLPEEDEGLEGGNIS